jgi:hypothetical protein
LVVELHTIFLWKVPPLSLPRSHSTAFCHHQTKKATTTTLLFVLSFWHGLPPCHSMTQYSSYCFFFFFFFFPTTTTTTSTFGLIFYGGRPAVRLQHDNNSMAVVMVVVGYCCCCCRLLLGGREEVNACRTIIVVLYALPSMSRESVSSINQSKDFLYLQ